MSISTAQMKVMGNRTLRTSWLHEEAASRLMAFDTTTLAPVEAVWTYAGESNSTTSTTFLDYYPQKEIIVSSAGYPEIILRPLNISNCTHYGSLSPDTENALFVVKDDFTISGWGPGITQYPFPDGDNNNVAVVYPASRCATALRRNNTIFSWGNPADGGHLKESDINRNDITDIRMSFGMGLLTGVNIPTVSQWGMAGTGSNDVPENISNLTNIIKVQTNGVCQIALTDVGTVHAWGAEPYITLPDEIAVLTDITDVCITDASALARRKNGQVVAWGKAYDGGILPDRVAALSDINMIFSSSYDFTVLRENRTLMFWGQYCPLSSEVEALQDIVHLGNSHMAFDSAGKVYLWDAYGKLTSTPELSDVVSVTYSSNSYAALKKDGSVVTWGTGQGADTTSVNELLTDILAIYPTKDGFIAMKADKTLVAWGNKLYQEDNASIPPELQGKVTYQY